MRDFIRTKLERELDKELDEALEWELCRENKGFNDQTVPTDSKNSGTKNSRTEGTHPCRLSALQHAGTNRDSSKCTKLGSD